MTYGDKRDYRKIDILVCGKYACSTTWARTLREAKAQYFIKTPGVHIDNIKAIFSTRS